MKIIYISGKYRDTCEYNIRKNILLAEETAVKIMKTNPEYYCIIPHKNTAWLGGVVSDKQFIEGSLEILKRCDFIYMLPNWRESEGARAEYQCAVDNKITFLYDNKI